jgi:hypothetical protein
VWGTDTPKDRDEVNKREVCECDGYTCDIDVIGVTFKFRLIHNSADLRLEL